MPLSNEKIQQLLALRDKPKLAGTPVVIKQGPVRGIPHGIKTRRCVNRGCMTPAKWYVGAYPYCEIHTVYHLNSIIVEQSGEGVEWKKPDPLEVTDLLGLLYDVLHDITNDYMGQVSNSTIEKIEQLMNTTHYPSLRRQIDASEELRVEGVRITA